MNQNQSLAGLALKLAKQDLGQREATGHNDGTYVRGLQRWLANGLKWMDGQPWCATFATYKIYAAAKILKITPVLKKNGSSTSIYAEAKQKGLLLSEPIHGCIGLIRGNGGAKGKTHHHTFFVDIVDAKANVVHGIDGNWKNAVSQSVHLIKECDFVAVV